MASRSARRISVEFLGDAADLEKAAERAESSIDSLDSKMRSAGDSIKRSSDDAASGFDTASEAADGAENKAQGLASTLTGTQDTMLGVGQIAKGNLFEGFVLAGGGAADLAEGLNYTVIPAAKFVATTVRAKIALIGHKAASIASAVASKVLAAAQWVLNAAMSANPIGLVVVALAALAVGLVVAYKKSETFRKIVNAAWDGVKKSGLAVVNFITDKFVPIFTEKIPDAASKVVDWVKSHWKTVIFTLLTGGLGLALKWVSDKFDLKDKISTIVGNTTDWVRDHWKTVVLGLFTGGLGLVVSWVAQKWDLREKISNVVSDVVTKIKSIPDKLVNLPDRMLGLGKRLIGQLKSGVVDSIKGIGSWLKDHVAQPIIDAVLHWFGIKSPSKKFEWIGSMVMEGFFKGLSSGDMLSVAKKVFGSLPDALRAIVNKGLVSIGDLSKKALNALGPVASGLDTALYGDTLSNQQIGRRLLDSMGWGAYWPQFNALVMGESGWNNYAQNPTSSAYGIGQFLDSTWATVGYAKTSDAGLQIAAMLKYILQRYGNPAAAYSAWLSRSPHWYGQGLHGAVFDRPTLIGVGDGMRPERVDVTPIGGRRAGNGGVTIIINGALDPNAVAKQVQQMLLKLKRQNGRELGIA